MAAAGQVVERSLDDVSIVVVGGSSTVDEHVGYIVLVNWNAHIEERPFANHAASAVVVVVETLSHDAAICLWEIHFEHTACKSARRNSRRNQKTVRHRLR